MLKERSVPTVWSSLLVVSGMVLILSGCGGGSGGGSAVTAARDNQTAVIVDAGPAQVNAINTLYTSVTLCAPGSTSQCQTIDHIQVDTGSTGFRVLASALGNGVTPSQLKQVNDASGNALVECTQFADGYSWGPVKLADVSIAGETASGLSIQVIGDPSYPSSLIPAPCINIPNAEENTVLQFGANGILGIGNFLQDCGEYCAQSGTQTGSVYSACTNSLPATCQPAAVAIAQQVSNPVAAFAVDNNGVIITLPSVAAAGATNPSGTLTFGIGTQANNQPGAARVYTLDPNQGTLTTSFNGAALTQSFVDSGSNAYYFPDSAITPCQDQTFFYCPASTLSLSGEMQGTNGALADIAFSVSNADSLSAQVTAAPDFAGPSASTLAQSFDWGVPFSSVERSWSGSRVPPSRARRDHWWRFEGDRVERTASRRAAARDACKRIEPKRSDSRRDAEPVSRPPLST